MNHLKIVRLGIARTHGWIELAPTVPTSSSQRGLTVYNLLPGFILAQNYDGPLKLSNGPYPIQMHATFKILMGHLKFLWALRNI